MISSQELQWVYSYKLGTQHRIRWAIKWMHVRLLAISLHVMFVGSCSHLHGSPLLTIVHFRWLKDASGTVCYPTSSQLQLLTVFPNNLKTYLPS